MTRLGPAADRSEKDVGLGGPARPWLARYGFALAVTLGSIVVSLAVMPTSDTPVYSLLVGAVAVSVWYGGLGPGLLAIATGWTLSLVIFVGPAGHPEQGSSRDLIRWGIPLLVAVAVVWIALVMRLGRERAVVAVGEAEAAVRDLAAIQQVASALSAALTPSDVAHVLVQRTPAIIGASGGSVGLVEGDEVVIVDPVGVTWQTHPPGSRLPLDTRAPIARAARDGHPVVVRDRETFVRSFPDGVALTPYVQAAIAVPIVVAGEAIGSMSLLFDRSGVIDVDGEAIVAIVADLGGQALERSRLYGRELEASRALDRILRVAPRLHADSREGAAEAICREGRITFGADIAALWRVSGDRMTLVRSDPVLDLLPQGLEASIDDFPGLVDTIGTLRVSFVSDIQEEARGAGLERTRELGIRSSLRTPIVVGDRAEVVLTISWETVVSEPDPSTLLLLRRFTDQAGLALEQVERRRAQKEADRRASEARRLQEVTAALSQAPTATDVGNVCLEHAFAAVEAAGGLLGVLLPDRETVRLVTTRGYEDAELEPLATLSLEAELPLCAAIRTGSAIWALDDRETASFTSIRDPGHPERDVGWVALPFKAGAVQGAVQLSFRELRQLDEQQREWLLSLVTQCGQALERSQLFDDEQRLRRRSERLQGMTAALSGSLTRAEVAEVAVEEIGAAIGAEGVALGVVVEDRQLTRVLASQGFPEELVESWLGLALDSPTPATQALRRRVSSFFAGPGEFEDAFPGVGQLVAATGHQSFLFVPLVVGRQATGLVIVSWAEPTALSTDDRSFVETLVGQAALALDRARHFETERTIAETLQRSVLPVSLPRVDGVQLAARYLPGTAELDVGGDWFDAIPLAGGMLGLVVGDVVGKGVQAAATMAQLRNALRAFSLDQMKPSSTIARLNRLAEETFETAFATVAYLVLDPAAGVCRIACAGHPPPLVAYPDGRVELLESGRGLPLGAGPDSTYRQEVVALPHGAVLLLYTDGLVERRARSIDDGLDELRRVVQASPKDPERLVEHVLHELVGDGERGDDIAILAVRLLAVAPQPLHLRVPANLGSLEIVREALRIWLDPAPLEVDDAHDVVLATWEACANAVEHAQSPRDEFIDVFAEVVDSSVLIRVEDSGRWVPPVERMNRGLGLKLMHAAMTTVRFDSSAAGTSVRIEKALTTGSDDHGS